MVVDIRYHLASLVAVFLSLGLGVLIGTSLAGDGEELHRRDQWLTALEREFDAVRERAKAMEAAMDRLTDERDRYAAFSSELVEALVSGRLEGKRVAVVTLGDFEGALEVEGLLLSAGAELVQLEAPDGATGEAECVALLLGTSGPGGRELLLRLLSELGRARVTAVAVVQDESWRGALEETSTPYVTHIDSPMGKFSLLLLLSRGGEGAYGLGAGLSLWPKELF